MRVLFSSTRGTGHLQPLLPYAHALRAHGHEVLVAAPAEVEPALRQAGLAFAPFDHPGDDLLGPIWARFARLSPDEIIVIALREIFAGLNARAAYPRLRDTIESWRPDLIVRDSVEFAAIVAAARAGVPHARVAVHMVSFEQSVPGLAAEPLDQLRRDAGLPADGAACLGTEPVFSAFPASLDPVASQPAPEQPAPFRVRMAEQPRPAGQTWVPASADARPLVYITFGTIAGTSPRLVGVYRTALEAIAGLPVRALLTTGKGMPAGTLGAIPDNVQVAEWVPQHEVLPHTSALVCHGGSGTVRGALAAGLPMVVVPLGADQPHNARRVAAVGAGIALPDPDPARLRAAIERVLADESFTRSARRIAAEIAALPPIEAAVAALVALAAR